MLTGQDIIDYIELASKKFGLNPNEIQVAVQQENLRLVGVQTVVNHVFDEHDNFICIVVY